MKSDINILETFLELLENNFHLFSPQALQDLPQLDRKLGNLLDDEIEPAINLIIDWCAEHPPLGKKIADGCRQVRREHPIEPPPEEIGNMFRPLSEKVKAKLKKLKKQEEQKNG
jgi:hypothetical protein